MLKNKLIYLFIIIFFCCSDSPINNSIENENINENNINWFYDVDNEELLIQIDTDDIVFSINSLEIRLHPFQDSYFEIFDDGDNSDLIPNNNIYSVLFEDLPPNNYTLYTKLDIGDNLLKEFEYQINFNSPTIINNGVYPYIPSEHILDQNNITFLDLILAVYDEDGRNDIEDVRFYIKKINFFNGSLSDEGNCNYDLVQEDNYIWDPTWIMNYESTNTDEYLLYRAQIPMNPIISESDCGGFGEVQFKFEVKDSKGFMDILEFDNIIEICPGICE